MLLKIQLVVCKAVSLRLDVVLADRWMKKSYFAFEYMQAYEYAYMSMNVFFFLELYLVYKYK